MTVLLFLLDTVFFALVAAALLRAWMNTQRVRMTQQPGPFLMALTNWLVMPLRRVLPRRWAQHSVDVGSLLAALVLAALYALCYALIAQGLGAFGGGSWLVWLPLLAGKMLLRCGFQLIMLLAFVYAILSWVQPQAPVQYLLARLIDPLVAPIRRVVPTIGGVDLSLLVLIVLMQIGLIVMG